MVLSPLVEAMKTSASAMPASIERVDLERGADREAPAGGLPGLPELDVEPLVRERVLVEHGDGVTGAQRGGGDGGADAAGADDEDEHAAEPTGGPGRRRDGAARGGRVGPRWAAARPRARHRFRRRSRARGGAVRITRQGALLIT